MTILRDKNRKLKETLLNRSMSSLNMSDLKNSLAKNESNVDIQNNNFETKGKDPEDTQRGELEKLKEMKIKMESAKITLKLETQVEELEEKN